MSVKGAFLKPGPNPDTTYDFTLLQVRSFQRNDSPSEVCCDSQPDRLTSDNLPCPPGLEGSSVVPKKKPKVSYVDRLEWIQPPKFIINDALKVASGEASTEVEAQTLRETQIFEAVYQQSFATPCSLVSPHVEAEDYDDSQTPTVPLIGAEEQKTFDSSFDVSAELDMKILDVPKGTMVAALEDQRTTIDCRSWIMENNKQTMRSGYKFLESRPPMLDCAGFTIWKKDMLLYLSVHDYDYAMTHPKPSILNSESTPKEIKAYEKWEKSNKLCMSLMLQGIPVALREALPKDVPTAMAFLREVEKAFAKNKKVEMHHLLNELSTKKYTGRGKICEHILAMSAIGQKLKAIGVDLPEKCVVAFVFQSLPEQFKYFQFTYNCLGENWNINELISYAAQEEERLDVIMSEAHAVTSSNKMGRKRNADTKGSSQGQVKKKKSEESTVGRCFFCKEKGHVKKDCEKRRTYMLSKGYIKEQDAK